MKRCLTLGVILSFTALLNGESINGKTIPQIIFNGEWTTTITLQNLTTGTSLVGFDFIGADGKPLKVPFINNPPLSSGSVSIPPGGTVIFETVYRPDSDPVSGWGKLTPPSCLIVGGSVSCPQIAATVSLKNRNSTRPDFEAVLPFQDPRGRTLLMIDNRNSESVLMLVNDSPFASPVSFEVTCKDNKGKVVLFDQITMSQNASMIFNLKEKWPILETFVGALEFTSSTRTIVLSAIRINPTNSFTPIPTFGY